MRSGWMSWVRTAAAGLALAAGLWAQGAGAAEIKNVKAEYVWPWGVGIQYEVVGEMSNDILNVTATDRANNAIYIAMGNTLSGDTDNHKGVHNVVWNMDKQGIKLQSTNVVFTVEYLPLSKYCVVNLSGGANASSYSVIYMDEPPSGGFNTDEYKTTKLVLRRIEAGTFTMGSPSNESGRNSDESQHKVTLTKPFYIGLFEVTQKQYKLVTGSNPSDCPGDKYPVESLSWNDIRGDSDTYDWPSSLAVDANSFIGRLRARTGLAFDLPTEAQWEYACRAGTTTAYSYGGSANGDYMWYRLNLENPGKPLHDVGTKKANPWGIYDMHGNVSEWCLDWYAEKLGTEPVTDPHGALSESRGRVARGGWWGAYGQSCRSACRFSETDAPWDSGFEQGFRLARNLAE